MYTLKLILYCDPGAQGAIFYRAELPPEIDLIVFQESFIPLSRVLRDGKDRSIRLIIRINYKK